MWRHRHSVVHPLPVPACCDDSRAAEIGEMTGDFWLRSTKDLRKETHANLLIPHKVEQPEASVIAEGLKKPFHVKRC